MRKPLNAGWAVTPMAGYEVPETWDEMIDQAKEIGPEQGKIVVAQSGCLACHKIGHNGNDGPGPELTEIADKLPKAAILRTLENPTAPMPSFAGLPEEKKTAMVDFLSQLHGE